MDNELSYRGHYDRVGEMLRQCDSRVYFGKGYEGIEHSKDRGEAVSEGIYNWTDRDGGRGGGYGEEYAIDEQRIEESFFLFEQCATGHFLGDVGRGGVLFPSGQTVHSGQVPVRSASR